MRPTNAIQSVGETKWVLINTPKRRVLYRNFPTEFTRKGRYDKPREE